MSDDRPKRESMSLEEATISNMWEIATIAEVVLERNGLCTGEEKRGHSELPPISWTPSYGTRAASNCTGLT